MQSPMQFIFSPPGLHNPRDNSAGLLIPKIRLLKSSHQTANYPGKSNPVTTKAKPQLRILQPLVALELLATPVVGL